MEDPRAGIVPSFHDSSLMSNKLQNLVCQFERAVDRISDALAQERNDYIRDAAIQRFEFTFELAWKTLKAFLEE